MTSKLFILHLLCLLFLHATHTKEYLLITNPSPIDNKIVCNNEQITIQNKAGCIINCENDWSCSTNPSAIPTLEPPEIHCPSNGTCIINCIGNYSCAHTSIFTYNCSTINITAVHSYSLYNTSISTQPKSMSYSSFTGILSIENQNSMNGYSNVMSHLRIDSSNIHEIHLNCHSNGLKNYECNEIEILSNITFFCDSNADCSASQLHCMAGTHCHLICEQYSNCRNISIFTENGIPSDIELECNGNQTCANDRIFCGQDFQSACRMIFNDGIWKCIQTTFDDNHQMCDGISTTNTFLSYIYIHMRMLFLIVCCAIGICILVCVVYGCKRYLKVDGGTQFVMKKVLKSVMLNGKFNRFSSKNIMNSRRKGNKYSSVGQQYKDDFSEDPKLGLHELTDNDSEWDGMESDTSTVPALCYTYEHHDIELL